MNKILFILLLVNLISCSKSEKSSNEYSPSNDLKEIIKITTLEDKFEGREEFYENTTLNKRKQYAKIDEQKYLIFERTVLEDWKESFRSKNLNKFLEGFDKEVLISNIDSMTLKREIDGISEFNWNTSFKNLNNKKEIENFYTNYLNDFKNIEHVELVTRVVRSNSLNMRNNITNEIEKAELGIKFDVRGIGKNEQRINDRADLIISIVNFNGAWKINTIEIEKGERLISSAPHFLDSTVKMGLDKLKVYPRREAIRRGGYALSTYDINKDGLLDLYVGNMGKSQVAYGKKNGNDFSFEIDENSEIANDTLVKTALFADYDNDNNTDLLTIRFDQAIKDTHRQEDVRFYRGDKDSKFTLTKALQNTNKENYAMPGALADFNKDGFLDIYIGFPGAQDFTFFDNQRLANNYIDAQGLYLNNKNGTFEDQTHDLVKRGPNQVCCNIYPHSVVAVDYNLDNNMDLVVVDDAGGLSHIYQNEGDAKFSQVVGKVDAKLMDFGMSAAVADVFNTGKMDILFSSVNFNPATRLQNSFYINYNVSTSSEMFSYVGFSGLKFYKAYTKPDNTIQYVDLTNVVGLDFAGEGLAAAEFIDFNNDGLLDIYVSNGLWSGDSSHKKNDISSLFIRSKFFIDDVMVHLRKIGSKYLDYNRRERSQSFFMDILTEFKGDVLTGVINSNGDRPSLSGFQKNRLFRNNGDQTFTEIGYLAGVDSIQDGYIISTVDINRDGKMDLILRNSDPSFVNESSRPVEVFINNIKNENHSLILTLEGVESNKNAIGSLVRAKINGKDYIRQLLSNNGSAQSEMIIHIGMGKNKFIEELEITWPNGKKQNLKNISNGKLHVKENISIAKN